MYQGQEEKGSLVKGGSVPINSLIPVQRKIGKDRVENLLRQDSIQT